MIAAKECAKKSVCHRQHACVLFNKNTILSEGYNDYIFKRGVNTNNYTIHAEMKAIKPEKLRKFKSKKFNMLVIRIDKYGNLRNSKPCVDCVKVIKTLPIKKIYYSDDDGNIISISKNALSSDHRSAGFYGYGSKCINEKCPIIESSNDSSDECE